MFEHRKQRSNARVIAFGQRLHAQALPQKTIKKRIDESIFFDPRNSPDRRIDSSPLSCPSPDRRRGTSRRKMACLDEHWWMYRRYTPRNYSSL